MEIGRIARAKGGPVSFVGRSSQGCIVTDRRTGRGPQANSDRTELLANLANRARILLAAVAWVRHAGSWIAVQSMAVRHRRLLQRRLHLPECNHTLNPRQSHRAHLLSFIVRIPVVGMPVAVSKTDSEGQPGQSQHQPTTTNLDLGMLDGWIAKQGPERESERVARRLSDPATQRPNEQRPNPDHKREKTLSGWTGGRAGACFSRGLDRRCLAAWCCFRACLAGFGVGSSAAPTSLFSDFSRLDRTHPPAPTCTHLHPHAPTPPRPAGGPPMDCLGLRLGPGAWTWVVWPWMGQPTRLHFSPGTPAPHSAPASISPGPAAFPCCSLLDQVRIENVDGALRIPLPLPSKGVASLPLSHPPNYGKQHHHTTTRGVCVSERGTRPRARQFDTRLAIVNTTDTTHLRLEQPPTKLAITGRRPS